LRAILYTKDFNENIKEPVDVILSPQYYWIKKIDIPIKSLKDAKKIAKTMFKLDENYYYGAFETDGKYFAYAIDKNLKLDIDKKYINSIRLAQSELYNYDKLNVSDQHSIQKIDDLLFCFPYEENAEHINEILPKINLSKHKINLYNNINIDKGILVSAALLFIVLNAGLLLNYFYNKKALKNLQTKKDQIIKKYSLPKTTFQLDSILNSLKNEDSKQKKIRKNLEYITKTPLKQNEKFLSLSYSNGSYSVEVKTSRDLDNYFKKRFKVSSIKNKTYKAALHE